LQELEETVYWLELLEGSGIVKKERLEGLLREADELTAIMVTIAKNIKTRKGES
jgi:four helix bundle protein